MAFNPEATKKKEKLVKKNKAIQRTNKLKTGMKALKGVKAISNALGTSPTDTPDVNTTYEEEYIIDDNGVGSLQKKKY